MCCTAMRRTVSLSSLRDMALQVGTSDASSSMKLFILSLRRFSIWLWASLQSTTSRHLIKPQHTVLPLLTCSVKNLHLETIILPCAAFPELWIIHGYIVLSNMLWISKQNTENRTASRVWSILVRADFRGSYCPTLLFWLINREGSSLHQRELCMLI